MKDPAPMQNRSEGEAHPVHRTEVRGMKKQKEQSKR